MAQTARMSVTASALDIATLQAALDDPRAGGYASFEGRVRDRNEGREVRALHYEAHAPICISEGDRIIAEALARFDILDARCSHRTGDLELGEVAVWVGVTARHRDAAFAACRYIIDEVKHRLPIWKKEFYVGGDSGWVNCAACAGHAHAPDPGDGQGADPTIGQDHRARGAAHTR